VSDALVGAGLDLVAGLRIALPNYCAAARTRASNSFHSLPSAKPEDMQLDGSVITPGFIAEMLIQSEIKLFSA
jgi:hypothetical protein